MAERLYRICTGVSIIVVQFEHRVLSFFCLLHIRFWMHDFVSPDLFFSPLGAGGAGAKPRRVRPAYSRTLCLPSTEVDKPPSNFHKSRCRRGGTNGYQSPQRVFFPAPANKMAHGASQGQRGGTLVSCRISQNRLTTWPVGASIRAERKIAAPHVRGLHFGIDSPVVLEFFHCFLRSNF